MSTHSEFSALGLTGWNAGQPALVNQQGPRARLAGFRNQRGAILMESLVALGLFGIAMMTIGDLMVQHIRMEGTNGTITTAVALAAGELEDLRGMPYDNIQSRSSTQTDGALTYTITTTVVEDSPAPELKSISTQVTWTEPNGAQSFTLNAIYTGTSVSSN